MREALVCLALLASVTATAPAQYQLASHHPRVCLASFDKGKVKLRYYSGMPPTPTTMKATEKNDKGELVEFTYTIERRSINEQMLVLDPETIDVYTVEGKQLDSKDLGELLSREPRVLACSRKPDLEMLRAAKKGTLLLIVPVALDPYSRPVGVVPVPSKDK
jgi:hypothetical protein